MEDFQQYRAIIDIDGNSWSERFPRLLCMNSVVIKIDPEQVDYFWPTLQEGVHYLRAANLSHLVQVARYATSDDNEQEMQRIVANARAWCRQRMVRLHYPQRVHGTFVVFSKRISLSCLWLCMIGGKTDSVGPAFRFEWIR
jgi:hypothetical protein